MSVGHLHYEPLKEIVQEKNISCCIDAINEEKYIEESYKNYLEDNANWFENMNIDEDVIELDIELINANKRLRRSLHQLKKHIRNNEVFETNLVRKPCRQLNSSFKNINIDENTM